MRLFNIMKTFLIQIDENGIPVTDMGFEVINAIKFHNWSRAYISDRMYRFTSVKNLNSFNFDSDEKNNTIPVGTIEFIEEFMFKAFSCLPKAINIPNELMGYEFLKRNIFFKTFKNKGEETLVKLDGKFFVKDCSKIKGVSGITDAIDDFFMISGREAIIDNYMTMSSYMISEIVSIKSEWRCFVFDGTLLDIRRYSGDMFTVPSEEFLNKAIDSYKKCPPAYTIDVAVLDSGETVVIECHNFWATGLYGFNNGDRYLRMLTESFKWEVKNARKVVAN